MRIHRSVLFRIGTVSRRAMILAGSSVLVLATLVTTALILQRPQTTHAATPPDTCFNFNLGTGTITDYYDNEANNPANPACPRAVDIPSTIGGVTVTTIGSSAFYQKQLTAVTIPDTVVTIEANGFRGNLLSSVAISDFVTSIGIAAFQDNQLTSLIIGSSVILIDHGAFFNNQLTSVAIPHSVTSFGFSPFDNNPITSMTIAAPTIPANFMSGNSLTSLTLEEGVETIRYHAFYGNNLTSVTIPDSVISIDSYAFQANQLTSVTIGNSVTSIGNSAFYNNQLTTITVPNSVTSIGHNAFSGNPLISVIIAAPTIPAGVFGSGYITTLTSLTLETGVISINNGAFSGNQLTSLVIPDSVTSIGDGAFASNKLTSVTIPDSVTSIGGAAFANNQLTSVAIPNSVTTISDAAFASNNLASVTIEGNPIIGTNTFAHNGFDQSTIPSGFAVGSADRYNYYQTNARFVRLYASNPAFLAANTDTLYTSTANSTTYTTSGYLINPAPVTVRYVDTNGNELQPSTVHVSDTYPDYLISSNPGAIASPSTPIAPTAYYRAGNTKSFTAPNISGYILTSDTTQSPTLAAGDNTVTFTYAAPVYHVPFATNTVTNYVMAGTTPPGSLSSNLITNSSLSIPSTSNPCSAISDASLVPVTGALASAAPANTTLLGGVNFTLHCTNAAETVVTYTLGGAVDASTLRVYKSNGSTLTDITDDVTITSTNGVPVISYSLQDGGDYDEDGIVNGIIVDPVYIGVVNSSSSGTLAETGNDIWPMVLAGSGAILSSGLLAGIVCRRNLS